MKINKQLFNQMPLVFFSYEKDLLTFHYSYFENNYEYTENEIFDFLSKKENYEYIEYFVDVLEFRLESVEILSNNTNIIGGSMIKHYKKTINKFKNITNNAKYILQFLE